jgi:arsenate reductase (thioredoxin)
MSRALFERAAAGRHTALSVGTKPGDRVHPEVIEVMRELGMHLADRRPQLLTRKLAAQADIVVALRRDRSGETAPVSPTV